MTLPRIHRRHFLAGGLAATGLTLLGRHAALAATVNLPFENGVRPLAAYPQKRPLIVLTTRPVQLETPFAVFDEGPFTPNDAFFVRWHLAGIPTTVDGSAHRISVHGLVNTPLQLSVSDLKTGYDAVEIAAVCECSGNSRGFFSPRVAGGQWANGAMGNAKWKGARLKDILAKAGVKDGSLQVRFRGLESPVLPTTPAFVKAIDVDLAMNPDVIVAYAMNGTDLPLLNGYPVRLVIPGYFATYWVKMLNDIEVIGETDQNFWMKTAYRIPANPCGCQQPGEMVKTVPINRLTVRSFITNVPDGARLAAGKPHAVKGIAFDSGYGIARVLFSSDGGQSWSAARLGNDLGKYGFREWQATFTPAAGAHTLASLAINTIGESQRLDIAQWNPSGYLRNIVERVRVNAGGPQV